MAMGRRSSPSVSVLLRHLRTIPSSLRGLFAHPITSLSVSPDPRDRYYQLHIPSTLKPLSPPLANSPAPLPWLVGSCGRRSIVGHCPDPIGDFQADQGCNRTGHIFGKPTRKEYCYDNLRITRNAWDTNLVKVGLEPPEPRHTTTYAPTLTIANRSTPSTFPSIGILLAAVPLLLFPWRKGARLPTKSRCFAGTLPLSSTPIGTLCADTAMELGIGR